MYASPTFRYHTRGRPAWDIAQKGIIRSFGAIARITLLLQLSNRILHQHSRPPSAGSTRHLIPLPYGT
jgi:hypothetical protein